jgi:acyl-CoA reductase-like NAD-dependent aldehyde dehydrogenase
MDLVKTPTERVMAGLLDAATGVLIDGKWLADGPTAIVRDKFTQQPAAEVRLGTEADADAAVTSAAAAAEHPLSPSRRHAILSEAARLLAARASEVTENYIAETGFTRADAAAELARATSTLRLSAEEAVRIAGEEVPVAATPGSENRLAFTIRVPAGVVVAITPFNAPLNTVAHKIGPALAAGNAVVLKRASTRAGTPGSQAAGSTGWAWIQAGEPVSCPADSAPSSR